MSIIELKVDGQTVYSNAGAPTGGTGGTGTTNPGGNTGGTPGGSTGGSGGTGGGSIPLPGALAPGAYLDRYPGEVLLVLGWPRNSHANGGQIKPPDATNVPGGNALRFFGEMPLRIRMYVPADLPAYVAPYNGKIALGEVVGGSGYGLYCRFEGSGIELPSWLRVEREVGPTPMWTWTVSNQNAHLAPDFSVARGGYWDLCVRNPAGINSAKAGIHCDVMTPNASAG